MMSGFTRRMNPPRIVLLGFITAILLGTLLLMLPFASKAGEGTPFLSALFTATSATCVTGLVVCDTFSHWSVFGQAVILLLIQIGGMGVVTIAVALSIISGKKISLRQRWIMQESISAPHVGGILRQTRFILKTAFLLEALGALALSFRFVPMFGLGRGLWFAVFHSVSAFCNAGFDLMGVNEPFSSMTAFTGDPLVVVTLSLLIISGGVGFLTWGDIRDKGLRFRRYSVQSRVVLVFSALLLVGGFACYEGELLHNSGIAAPGAERFLAAIFQSVTTRTAGFNTLPLDSLGSGSQLVTIMLMLVGGATGSTAGGFKVNTLAVLLLTMISAFRGKANAEGFGRRLSAATIRNAVAIFLLYMLLFVGGGLLIRLADGIPLMGAMFEAASAVATVGLSLGYTPGLSAVSRVLLIFRMYFGRVGGLTLMYAVVEQDRLGGAVRLPEETVAVG